MVEPTLSGKESNLELVLAPKPSDGRHSGNFGVISLALAAEGRRVRPSPSIHGGACS
jgi:hypothetical protein